MDLVRMKGFQVIRRRKWVWAFVACGCTGYGVYKIYHLPSVARKRARVMKLLKAFISIINLVSDAAEVVGVVSKDLEEFLSSDSDEIPNTLKQISKILNSEEFLDSFSFFTQALTTGVLSGYCKSIGQQHPGPSSVSVKIMDKMSTPEGCGFVSAIVGSFARNLVLGFNGFSANPLGTERWVDVLTSNESRKMVADCIRVFVGTMVSVYLERTSTINTYEQFFSGMTNPEHEDVVKDVLVSVSRCAVETLVKTAHQVMTSPSSGLHLESDTNANVGGGDRRFLIDVTGKVTVETMKSFIDFLLFSVSNGLTRSLNTVNDEVMERGLQVVRYVSGKWSVIVAITVALYLHLLANHLLLLPS